MKIVIITTLNRLAGKLDFNAVSVVNDDIVKQCINELKKLELTEKLGMSVFITDNTPYDEMIEYLKDELDSLEE
jgi:hypothetical protein